MNSSLEAIAQAWVEIALEYWDDDGKKLKELNYGADLHHPEDVELEFDGRTEMDDRPASKQDYSFAIRLRVPEEVCFWVFASPHQSEKKRTYTLNTDVLMNEYPAGTYERAEAEARRIWTRDYPHLTPDEPKPVEGLVQREAREDVS